MLGNKEMIKSICDYIIKTKPVEKMSNDAFIMLGEIYVSQQLDEVMHYYSNLIFNNKYPFVFLYFS